jgi:hypothetical protein
MSHHPTEFGKLVPDHIQPGTRDAIHVACTPVKAVTTLSPGQHVNAQGYPIYYGEKTGVGVVDPFLKTDVYRGQTFWLFLYPGTITGLRHEWEHPAFPTVTAPLSPNEDALRIIQEMAVRLRVDFARMMEIAALYAVGDETRFHMGDNESYSNVSRDEWVEFWTAYEKLHGVQIEDKSPPSFSCAC